MNDRIITSPSAVAQLTSQEGDTIEEVTLKGDAHSRMKRVGSGGEIPGTVTWGVTSGPGRTFGSLRVCCLFWEQRQNLLCVNWK